ncbi:hypothetical protein ACWC6I_43420 [Streptomyces sp. NPDC001414]
MGRGRAVEHFLLGEPLLADEALRIGLANRVIADAELDEATRKIATDLGAGATKGACRRPCPADGMLQWWRGGRRSGNARPHHGSLLLT